MKRNLLLVVGGLLAGILLSLLVQRLSSSAREAAMDVGASAMVFAEPAPPPSPALAEPFGSRGASFGAPLEEKGRMQAKRSAKIAMVSSEEELDASTPNAPGEAGESASPSGRAWFPETFLFEPLVVTDAAGEASVPVKVPDRLTRWRVLALAHSRSGAQAGVVSGFAGSLPLYVDPVVPPFLRAGDVVRLPVQVVNTTGAAMTRALKVEARGVTVEGGTRTVTVPAAGSVVEYVTLRSVAPGPVTLKTSLEGVDTVERTFDVWPTGRPERQTHGGTLAAPRTLELDGPANALAGSERVRLLVFPGALGVLRSELAAAPGREGLPEDAYALMLAGRAPALLQTLGGTVDARALEHIASLTGQRVLRAGRAPDVATATLLAEAALAHPGNPVLARLGERLSEQVARAQRPDGTCEGGTGWTLQRLLVATADCTRVVRAGPGSDAGRRRALAFEARAAGAIERSLPRVKDAYTAAAVLASGGLSGSLRESLRERVREALQRRLDGAAFLPVAPGVVRADGAEPSEAEATALAVLALIEDPKAPLADLGTSLLADYRPERGWGDGHTNRIALQAALALFRAPLPAQVEVVLERDGQVVTRGTFDAKALHEVLALEAPAPGASGKHTWSVRAEPAVPGLGYSLTLAAYVPWKASEPGHGVELVLKAPAEAKVGMPVEVTLQLATPAHLDLTLRQELPTGVQVDRPSLDAMVERGELRSYDVEDGAVELVLAPRDTAAPFTSRFRVVPTLAGSLQAGAASLLLEGRESPIFQLPPTTWAVR